MRYVRQPTFFFKWKRPHFFLKWKTTSIFNCFKTDDQVMINYSILILSLFLLTLWLRYSSCSSNKATKSKNCLHDCRSSIDFHSSKAEMILVTSPGGRLSFMGFGWHDSGFPSSVSAGLVGLYICAMACTQQPL